MNKKLICLFLSLVMLLSVVLSGCAKKTDDDVAADKAEQASASAETLTMYLMSEAPVSTETATAIQNAVNKITENKFKTHMNLYFYTEEEYYDKLDAAFAAREKAKADGTLILPNKTEGETVEEETFVDENGIIRIKYPTYGSYQVDIFYLGGEEMYDKYMERGYLASLGAEVDSASKALKQYIAPPYLNYMKTVNNGIFAIPTNNPIGEYTYLLLNKKALAETLYSAEDGFTSLTCQTAQEFLEFIAEYHTNYVPLYTNLPEDELLLSNLQMWGIDEEGEWNDAFSVLGGYYNTSADYLQSNEYVPMESLFQNEQFVNDLTTLKEYKFNGYYGTEADADKEFAVGYVKGGAELTEVYGEDYEMVVLDAPRMSEEDLYEDLFAVSPYTVSTSRSMEIITFMNSNEEIKNLLQYGIEGEHYQVVDTGIENARGETYKLARRLNEDYMMDNSKTGNVLLAYTLEDENVLYNINDYIVKQNQEAKVNLALGFTPTYGGYKTNMEQLKTVQQLSDDLYKDYLACDNMTELEAFIKSAKQQTAFSGELSALLDWDHAVTEDGTNECDKACGVLACAYEAWLVGMKIKAAS